MSVRSLSDRLSNRASRGLLAGVFLLAGACGGGTGATPTSGARSPSPQATSPSPSPAAEVETLAFIRGGDVWLAGADGTAKRRLGLEDVHSFSWVSPAELDVVAGPSAERHLLVEVQGAQRELPSPPGGSWSRDGARYAASLGQVVNIFDRDGAPFSTIKVGPSRKDCGVPPPDQPRLGLGRPAFSPEGDMVVVAVSCWKDAGAYNFPATMYRASLDGARNERLAGFTTNLRRLTAPVFAPNGASIAQTETGGSSLCPVTTGLSVTSGDGTVVALTRGLFTQVTEDNAGRSVFGGVTGYGWSPDSDALVVSFDLSFCDLDTGKFDVALAGLYVLRLDGSPEEQLRMGATHAPAWSPSGAFIAYVAGTGRESPAGKIQVLNPATGAVISLGKGADPAWQPGS